MTYSTSSIVLLPEQGAKAFTQQHSLVQKCRRGRRPVSSNILYFAGKWSPISEFALTKHDKICTTAEERKQRNRQAQAAFRERRTAYINQSKSIIKQLWGKLQNQQRSRQDAAYKCLMLRYENSRLRRVLLEKGTHLRDLTSRVIQLLTRSRHRCPCRASCECWQLQSELGSAT